MGTECNVFLPRLTPVCAGGLPSGQVSVGSSQGTPIFIANFDLARAEMPLEICGELDNAVFAYCCKADAEVGEDSVGLVIHHRSGAPFGVLRTSAEGFRVVSHKGWRMDFHITSDTDQMNATDEHGRLLAVCEHFHGPDRRSIRVGPLVDAGLVVVALLGIDLLTCWRAQLVPATLAMESV